MGLFSKIKKGLKKVRKAVTSTIKGTWKKLKKVVKKVTKSKLFKAVATIGAIIVTGGAAIGAFGGSLASSTFGSWMVGASNTIAGGTLFTGTGAITGKLSAAGNFLTKMAAKPFAATGKAIGSVAGGVSDLTNLTTKQGRMGYRLDSATNKYVVDTSKTLKRGSLKGSTVAELKAQRPGENIMALGKGVDATTGKVMAGTLQPKTAYSAAQFTGNASKATGTNWGELALQTGANITTGVATGYALNELTTGDPSGTMTGLAVEGKEMKDPLAIYRGDKLMDITDIYQNLLYGPADPYSAGVTELFKQQTIGLPTYG